MPNFTAESWASFKQAFLSVIQFIMYCFDLAFDTFRSNPMLYLAFFFPVFALAFFVIFDLFTGIAPLSSLMRSYNGINTKSFLKAYNGVFGKHSNIKSQNLAVRRFQKLSEGSIKGINSSSSFNKAAAGNSGNFGSSVNLSGSGLTNPIVIHGLSGSIRKQYNESQRRKEQDEAIYAQIEEEQMKLANQHKQDFETTVFRSHYIDSEGRSVTNVETNIGDDLVSFKRIIDEDIDY